MHAPFSKCKQRWTLEIFAYVRIFLFVFLQICSSSTKREIQIGLISLLSDFLYATANSLYSLLPHLHRNRCIHHQLCREHLCRCAGRGSWEKLQQMNFPPDNLKQMDWWWMQGSCNFRNLGILFGIFLGSYSSMFGYVFWYFLSMKTHLTYTCTVVVRFLWLKTGPVFQLRSTYVIHIHPFTWYVA